MKKTVITAAVFAATISSQAVAQVANNDATVVQPKWEGGWSVVERVRPYGADLDGKLLSLLNPDPRKIHSYTLAESRFALFDSAKKLPVPRSVLPTAKELSAFYNEDEGDVTWGIKVFGAPNGSPLICGAKLSVNGVDVVADPAIVLGAKGGENARLLKAAQPVRMKPFDQLAVIASCAMRDDRKDDGNLARRYAHWSEAKALAGGIPAYSSSPYYTFINKPGSYSGPIAASPEHMMGATVEVVYSRNGGSLNSLPFGAVVYDANQAAKATAEAGVLNLQNRVDIPAMDDKLASGWLVDGFLQQGTNWQNWQTFGHQGTPTWNYAVGTSTINLHGYKVKGIAAAPDATFAQRLQSNFGAWEKGKYTILIGYKHNKPEIEYAEAHIKASIASGGSWRVLGEGNVESYRGSAGWVVVTANLDKGGYPIEITVVANPVKGGTNTITDANLTDGSVVVLVKGPADSSPRPPRAEEFFIERGNTDLPPISATIQQQAAPTKVFPAAPVKIGPAKAEPSKTEQPKVDAVRADDADGIGKGLAAGQQVDMSVTFASGSDELTADGRKIVGELAKVLAATPAIKVMIEGHTDDVGADDANMALSKKRAVAVAKELVAQGIDVARLQATGYGKTKPRVPNASDANRQINRRVTVAKI